MQGGTIRHHIHIPACEQGSASSRNRRWNSSRVSSVRLYERVSTKWFLPPRNPCTMPRPARAQHRCSARSRPESPHATLPPVLTGVIGILHLLALGETVEATDHVVGPPVMQ